MLLTILNIQDPPVPSLYKNYDSRGERRHVGGGGLMGKKKAHMSAYPPVLSLPPQYPPTAQALTSKVSYNYLHFEHFY